MNIKLSEEDVFNIRVCLFKVAKMPEFGIDEMLTLLMLSRKIQIQAEEQLSKTDEHAD